MSKKTIYEKLKTKFKCLDDYRRELMGLVAEIECDIIELQPNNLTGPAGECTCNIKSKELAGICSYCYPRSNWNSIPPLNARVAKAVGHACWTDQDGKWRSHMGRFIPNGVEYPFVPDYPNDLVAARDAFDLYFELQCRKIDDRFDYWIERFYKDGWKWRVRLGFADKSVVADSLEEGFCLAIVAHSDQQ